MDRLYYGPDTHADSLLVGCLFGCWFFSGRLPSIVSSERARKVSIALALILIAAAAVFIESIPPRLGYGLQLLPTGFAVVAAIFVVCAAVGGSEIARALSVGPLVFLGRISYALYLWHLPLLVALAGVHRDFSLRSGVAVAAAVGVAITSRYFVELPFLTRRRVPSVEKPEAATAATPAFAATSSTG